MPEQPKFSSAARWLAAIALGAFVVGASATFLTRNTPAVVSAAVVKPAVSTKRVPSYIARIEPLPPGSITAIAPLPKTVPVSQPAAAPEVVATTAPEPATADTFRVLTDVNVRRGASSQSPRVGSVRKGDVVTMLAREGKWILVDANGLQGWIYGKYLSAPNETTVAALN